ncbi:MULTISPECIES: phenylalanine--tRNA ligase subunit beta [Idiomarina]|uniref:phenylalanine--tRNA ligase subunit beta n=1 Tax=Idiomarina TaxID=135575 RepID=UPI00129BB0A4|nr:MULTISPECIES: phenylalanine--tRNA ligase subunit beta [Idiomarina]MRJ40687.1 phenylalanine--tRNA ligase subunit beta [Idiomarina sp. FeN1]NCU56491.1 phenylalanine--tRNA ligase subunit beta [Idiomarina sp. FenA--70]NCU58871.1 phenylalanine--tRNA ligase subunit beta [Idiomarina sp. FenBw--71]UUN14624.1 phenylalanine--tRNA ligase subunit beta [Idiomarina loihiensis]
MKFSEKWLRSWVNPALDSVALSEQLSMAGLEVDSIDAVAEDFSAVVVGEVIACGPHPDADKLQVTKVDIGADEPVDIVCGAPNCRLGLKVAVATVGAVLPGDFKIKKAKLRGQPSHGMLCSNAELGLSDDHDGIIELPADAPVGMDYRDYLELNDVTLDVDLTPNRADCLGIRGIAREVGVLNRLTVTEPAMAPVTVTHDQERAVILAAPAACPRYLGRIVRDLNVQAESPLWLRERLRRSGVRSIDPVVDVTNYVLLELGHPMHAFDNAKLEGAVQVRMAATGEQLTLLDGNQVTLTDDVLVIADEAKALAMAGIFGGADSGVTSTTTDVFLESAFFAPAAIAGRARRFGLHTDASHRYERGVDPELQRTAMERATALLIEICGGEAGPIVEAVSPEHLPQAAQIVLRKARLAKVLGISIAAAEVTDILTRLGFAVEEDADAWQVTVPTFRFDMAIEEDLIEEVARIYGYHRIQAAAPAAQLRMIARQEGKLSAVSLKRTLIDRGYQEAITYSFVDPKHQAMLFDDVAALTLPHPISVEMSSMRVSLWPGLVGAVAHNQKRQQQSLAFCETGLRFIPAEDAENGVRQQPMIAGIRAGKAHPEHWSDGERAVDFYDLKGDVEALLAMTGEAGEFRFVADQHPALHPGQTAAVFRGAERIGYLGAIHPQFEKKLGLNGRTYVFELELDGLVNRAVPEAQAVSKYPSIRRDLAIVVKQSIAAGEILAAIENIGVNHLVGLNLFDVYQGAGVAEGHRSLALSMTLQHAERTLEEQEINAAVAAVVDMLTSEFGATLRE